MSDINLSFTRNLKGVYWGGTLRVNLLRAFCAGLVWATFACGLGATLPVILWIVPICLVAHLFIGMPIGVAAYAVESSFASLIAIALLPGDPILYAISRLFRKSFPADGLHLFQMTPVLLLTRAVNVEPETKAYQVSSISGDGSGFVE